MKSLYNQIESKLSTIDFSALYPGFKRFPFALYDNHTVTMASQTFAKDNRFIGNTAIAWENDYLAIWSIDDAKAPHDVNLLTAKIVHEMFHAFQYTNQESRFPNELDALFYVYDSYNLSLKHQENILLTQIIDGNLTLFKDFLAIRKTRHHHFKKQAMYEAKTEMIEGMAQKIELEVLKQLNFQAYHNALKQLKKRITNISKLLPIRQISYDIGTALFHVLDRLNITYKTPFKETKLTVSEQLIAESKMPLKPLFIDDTVQAHIESFNQKRLNIIDDHRQNTNKIIEGPLTLLGLDPMHCFGIDNEIYCPHFLMFKNQNQTQTLKQPVLFTVDQKGIITQILIAQK